jgi:hypothetical protein
LGEFRDRNAACGDTSEVEAVQSASTAAEKLTVAPTRNCRSFRPDVGCPDHLGPFLGFIGDEFAKLGRRACNRRAPQVGEPRLDLGVGDARVDFLVELFDNRRGRVPSPCFPFALATY